MKLKFPLFNVELNVAREESDAERRRRKYRNTRKQVKEPAAAEDAAKEPKEAKKPAPDQVMMVKVENLMHEKFQQTEEVKALTQEVIKTIRDIINLNPLYRWVLWIFSNWFVVFFRRKVNKLLSFLCLVCTYLENNGNLYSR